MKNVLIFFFCSFTSLLCAQETRVRVLNQVLDTIKQNDIEADTIIDSYTIPEIYIGIGHEEEQYRRDMAVLRGRILRVYPYAKATAENLIVINKNLEKLETNRERRVYIKRSQSYLEGEFKEKLKKLSRNDGKILLKLIHRQTGETTYDLIKEFKSGWTAFWSNSTARTFSLNLKSEYHPETNLEDFYIETQLNYLFFNYRLPYASATPPIDFNSLRVRWKNQIKDDQFFPIELRD